MPAQGQFSTQAGDARPQLETVDSPFINTVTDGGTGIGQGTISHQPAFSPFRAPDPVAQAVADAVADETGGKKKKKNSVSPAIIAGGVAAGAMGAGLLMQQAQQSGGGGGGSAAAGGGGGCSGGSCGGGSCAGGACGGPKAFAAANGGIAGRDAQGRVVTANGRVVPGAENCPECQTIADGFARRQNSPATRFAQTAPAGETGVGTTAPPVTARPAGDGVTHGLAQNLGPTPGATVAPSWNGRHKFDVYTGFNSRQPVSFDGGLDSRMSAISSHFGGIADSSAGQAAVGDAFSSDVYTPMNAAAVGYRDAAGQYDLARQAMLRGDHTAAQQHLQAGDRLAAGADGQLQNSLNQFEAHACGAGGCTSPLKGKMSMNASNDLEAMTSGREALDGTRGELLESINRAERDAEERIAKKNEEGSTDAGRSDTEIKGDAASSAGLGAAS